jgi:hypothetical protein
MLSHISFNYTERAIGKARLEFRYVEGQLSEFAAKIDEKPPM